MQFLALLVGLAGLYLGTEVTIRGAVAIADRLRISQFVVGAVVLSIGSDLPELAIAVDAALKNLQLGEASDIVVGSSIGSCLGQIGLVLGVVGLISYLTLPRRIVYQHGGMMLGSLILLGLFAADGHVSRVEGISLIIVYAIYLVFVMADALAVRQDEEDDQRMGLVLATTCLVAGLAVVAGSAELTVRSATNLALAFNIEQSFIAIVIIGLGSSLPELSISLAAVIKKQAHMSVGNLIGSNIFDTLIPIGVAAVIADLKFAGDMLRFDLPILFILSTVVLVFFHQRNGVRKREAAIILGLYLGYAALKIGSL